MTNNLSRLADGCVICKCEDNQLSELDAYMHTYIFSLNAAQLFEFNPQISKILLMAWFYSFIFAYWNSWQTVLWDLFYELLLYYVYVWQTDTRVLTVLFLFSCVI